MVWNYTCTIACLCLCDTMLLVHVSEKDKWSILSFYPIKWICYLLQTSSVCPWVSVLRAVILLCLVSLLMPLYKTATDAITKVLMPWDEYTFILWLILFPCLCHINKHKSSTKRFIFLYFLEEIQFKSDDNLTFFCMAHFSSPHNSHLHEKLNCKYACDADWCSRIKVAGNLQMFTWQPNDTKMCSSFCFCFAHIN